MKTKLKLSMVFILLTLSSAYSQTPKDPLLEILLDCHRATKKSIRTLSCQVQSEWLLPENRFIEKGEYLRNGEMILIKEGEEGKSEAHWQTRNGEVRIVSRSHWVDGEPTSFRAYRQTENLFYFDVWSLMGLVFPGPNQDMVDLDTFCRQRYDRPAMPDNQKKRPGMYRNTCDKGSPKSNHLRNDLSV